MKLRNLIIILAVLPLLAFGCNKQTAQNQTTSSTTTNTASTNDNSNQLSDVTNSKDIYINSGYKISLDYNGLHMSVNTPGSYFPVQNAFADNGKDLLSLYLDPSVYKGTNLENAWFNLAINDKLDSKGCYAKLPNDDSLTAFTQKRVVQGNTWYYSMPNPFGDAGAGHQGETETYRLFKNNLCYEARLGLVKLSRDNLANPNSVKEIDIPKIFNYLGAVFNQLQIK